MSGATVVIPARNAAATIDEQLEALAAQTFDDSLEVLVVDNGSSDDTAARVARWSDRLAVRVLRAAGRRGPAYARNVGIASASSDLILLCDADDRVAPEWAAHLVLALGRAGAAAGRVIGWDEAVPPGPAASLALSPGARGAAFGFLPVFSTCNAALHKEVWQAVGGFDESLPTCEDIDLAWRIQLAGFELASCPEAVVNYRGPATASDEFRAWYGYGRYQPRLLGRFGPAGMRRDPGWRVAAKWAQLVVTSYRLAGTEAERRAWSREAGRRIGRLVGSVRERSLYL